MSWSDHCLLQVVHVHHVADQTEEAVHPDLEIILALLGI